MEMIKKSNWKFIFGMICVVAMFSAFIPKQKLETCIGDRFTVRTLTDLDAEKVNISPKIITISQLMAFNQVFPPDKKFNKEARWGAEFNTYQIYCKISQYKKQADGGYRLVLMDLSDTSKTIIAEMPNPDCDKIVGSKYANSFKMARTEFEKYVSNGHDVKSGTYNMAGVCFFDKVKGDFSAPNGICLSPIVDLEKFR